MDQEALERMRARRALANQQAPSLEAERLRAEAELALFWKAFLPFVNENVAAMNGMLTGDGVQLAIEGGSEGTELRVRQVAGLAANQPASVLRIAASSPRELHVTITSERGTSHGSTFDGFADVPNAPPANASTPGLPVGGTKFDRAQLERWLLNLVEFGLPMPGPHP